METRAVVEHLLFHKALLGDGDDGGRLNHYLAMVEEIQSGYPLGLLDPVERGIAAAFELTLEERLDPWAIDLLKFTQLYLERIRGEERVDFIAAGRLILMAWSVLRLQSDGVVEMAEPRPDPAEVPFLDWDLDTLGWDVPEGLRAGTLGQAPLARALRHATPRPVTLMELISALREAEANLRPAQPRTVLAPTPGEVEAKVHGEELTLDLKVTWDALVARATHEVDLADLWPADRTEAVGLLLALLFLARMGWVALHQPDLAVDAITIEVIGPPEAEDPTEPMGTAMEEA